MASTSGARCRRLLLRSSVPLVPSTDHAQRTQPETDPYLVLHWPPHPYFSQVPPPTQKELLGSNKTIKLRGGDNPRQVQMLLDRKRRSPEMNWEDIPGFKNVSLSSRRLNQLVTETGHSPPPPPPASTLETAMAMSDAEKDGLEEKCMNECA